MSTLIQPSLVVLVSGGTSHKHTHFIRGIAALITDLVTGIHNGHIHIVAVSQLMCQLRRVIALDGADLFDGFLHRNALTDENTCAAVTAVHTGTGNDKIADARQSCKGLFVAAHRLAKSAYLAETSGHERSLAVVAESQSVNDTCGKGNDIFYRTAKLDAYHISVGVNA